jgi:hypothetical protein
MADGSRRNIRADLDDVYNPHCCSFVIILTASCLSCDHKARKRLWQITAGLPSQTRLVDIDDRLRCMRCGSRGFAMLLVTVTEEE